MQRYVGVQERRNNDVLVVRGILACRGCKAVVNQYNEQRHAGCQAFANEGSRALGHRPGREEHPWYDQAEMKYRGNAKHVRDEKPIGDQEEL